MLVIILALVLSACTIPATPTVVPIQPASSVNSSGLRLEDPVRVVVVGPVITYTYTVTMDAGTPALPLPVTINDDKTTVPVCDNSAATVNNNNLDPGEIVTCTSTYSITEADLNAGSVTSNATAMVGTSASNRVTTVVQVMQNKVLTIDVVPNPTTYSAAGQTITYTYTVTNTGTPTLGPAQFVVSDDHAGQINCEVPKSLAQSGLLTCTGTYVTTQADMGFNQIVNSATASGGGAVTITPDTSTVTNTNVTSQVPPASGLTPSSTIQHIVVKGEWLIQIARCYGADFNAMRTKNPQVIDPHMILPAQNITVPNIGSNGPIYGPPCIGYHVVQSGETLDSIRTKYNADLAVLQLANRTVTFGNGACLRIPLNSALGATRAPSALTSCPGTTPSTPVTRDPIRVNIPAPGPSVTLTNVVDSSSKLRFLLATTQGQTLTVKVTAAANEVSLGVFAANGTTLKAQDTTLTFTGTIPVTGDTAIDIMSVTGTTSKSFTIEITLTTPTQPSSFERVADIVAGPTGSDPAYFAIFNNILYFRATDTLGAELWKYDPNSKLATFVIDIAPGSFESGPAFLTTYPELAKTSQTSNGAIYFRANGNDNAGAELWRYNGSAVGRLDDINGGPGDANPSYLAVFNSMLYFSAKGLTGVELWRTDGIDTEPAADINVGSGDSNPAYLTVFNGELYFSAVSTDGMGVELYKFDGGTTTTRVSDINPGVGNSNPSHLAVFNNALYFAANNGTSGVELWKYDGTANPPTRVADIIVGAGDSAPAFLTVFNGALYFSANDGTTGIELWKYDGSAPKLVKDLNTGGNSSSPSYMIVFNNELYFQANGNDGAGAELWKFKGP